VVLQSFQARPVCDETGAIQLAMNKWISTKEVTKMPGVSSTTIKRWADDGTLPSTRTSGGHRRFRNEAVDQFLRRQAAAGKDSPAGEFFDLVMNAVCLTGHSAQS